MTTNRHDRSTWLAVLALTVGAGVAGCGSDAVVDPVFVCRCAPDEICINETCTPVGDVRIVDAPGPDVAGCQPSDAVRIAELRHAGTERPDFIELAGAPGTSVENWYLRSREVDGTPRATVQLSGVLDTDGLWVAAFGSGLERAPDIDYGALGALGLASPGGTVELFDCNGLRVDAVGYGDFTDGEFRGEGSPAPTTAADQSLARCVDAEGLVVDSDDNAADFGIAVSPSPGVPNATCTTCDPAPLVDNVWISEVLYDPAGADADAAAFIEVTGAQGIQLDTALGDLSVGLWSRDASTALGIPVGTVSPTGRLVLDESDAFPIDADNDAGAVQLVACGTTVLDVVGWGDLTADELATLELDAASPDVPDGSALGRCPDDATGTFVELTAPTPGDPNACP